MEELDLRQYWHIIHKRLGLVLALPIVAAILSAAVSFFVLTPQYQASTTLLINQKTNANPSLEYQAVMANQAMVKTYTTIIKSDTIERSVIQKLKLNYTPGQLAKMVNVSSPDQSQVIEVDVTAPSQLLAVKIANSFGSEFQQRAQKLMDIQNVQIVDKAIATPNASPVKPNKKLNTAIAVVLGLMVSIGLAFLLEYLDNRLRTEEAVQRNLNIPVLGVIGEYGADGDIK